MSQINQPFYWTGFEKPCLDKPIISQHNHVTIGCYGGNSQAGAHKNEDAVFVLTAPDLNWTVAAVCDAHDSSESALLMIEFLKERCEAIATCLAQPIDTAFADLEKFILAELGSEAFKEKCQQVQGETAFLLCAQKGAFIWWFSVGDNLVYLLHPELAKMGQFALNQRNFFEWIGRVNSFALPVPSYSSGVRELRRGLHQILLVTDGVLEFEGSPYSEPSAIYELLMRNSSGNAVAIDEMLQRVHDGFGRDSAAVVSFSVDMGEYEGCWPENHK